jgi:hypothetical protein
MLESISLDEEISEFDDRQSLPIMELPKNEVVQISDSPPKTITVRVQIRLLLSADLQRTLVMAHRPASSCWPSGRVSDEA